MDDDTFAIPLEFKLLERAEPEVDSSTNSGIRRGKIKEDHDNPPKWTSTWIPWDDAMDVGVFLRNLKRELAAVGLAAARDIEGNLRARIAEYAILNGPSASKATVARPPAPTAPYARPDSAVPNSSYQNQGYLSSSVPVQSIHPPSAPTPYYSQPPGSQYPPVPFAIPPSPHTMTIPPGNYFDALGPRTGVDSERYSGSSRRRGRKSRRRGSEEDDDDENYIEEDDDDGDAYIPQRSHSRNTRSASTYRTRSAGLTPDIPLEGQESITSPPSIEKKRKSSKTCGQCQATVAITLRTCPHCGYEFVKQKSENSPKRLGLGKGKKLCKACQAVIASSRRECPECGVTCTKD